MKNFQFPKGIITTYALVFGVIFLMILAGLLSFILLQLRQTAQKVAWNEALAIAEAGVNYYKWCLNNEIEAICQTEKDYYDPAGNPVGKFSLEITPRISCGQTFERTLTSTGWTNNFPEIKRKVGVLYARPSIAQYSYVINDNVWVGSDHKIRGPFHSNGGIRMDGQNQSLVTSAKEEWICTSAFGCDPCPTAYGCWVEGSDCLCPGVFTTANGNKDLFSFPVPPFDFAGITIDLAQMKTTAQTRGIYLPPSNQINSRGKGYHLKFKNDSTFEVWIITRLSFIWARSLEKPYWHREYSIIAKEYLYQTYNINPNCSLIFIEDNLWPEGEIKGKVTVVSANLLNPNLDTNVVLPANLDYTTFDGSDGLALIGAKNVLIGPQSPNIMKLQGIFVAQKGYFGRNFYLRNIREKLEIYGSIISNGRVGTKWVSGDQVLSGYLTRESYFDANLVYNPPAFVPYIDPDFKIINWQELK